MTHIFKKNEEKFLSDLGGNSPVLCVAIDWENKNKSGLLNGILGNKADADLDLSCVVYDIYGERQDAVWYAQLKSKDGAVRHSGDLTVGGEEARDDEAITIDLNQLHQDAKTIFFVVSSFGHNGFAGVDSFYYRVIDAQTRREMARFDMRDLPQDGNPEHAKIVLSLEKIISDGLVQWRAKALDQDATGENVQQVFSELRGLLEEAA